VRNYLSAWQRNSFQALVTRILPARWQSLPSKSRPLSCRFGRQGEFVSRLVRTLIRGDPYDKRCPCMVGRVDDARRGRQGALFLGRARVSLEVAGLLGVALSPRRCRDPGGAPLAAPCTTPLGSHTTRSLLPRRFTSTTCTSSGVSQRRRPRWSGACGRGLPMSTSTTGCLPTGSASSADASTWCAAGSDVRLGAVFGRGGNDLLRDGECFPLSASPVLCPLCAPW
jgi:hypothetical protein